MGLNLYTPDATQTIKGKIRLTGDLAGTAESPQLSSTGVVAGLYNNANVTVDAKGRIVSISNGTGGSDGGALVIPIYTTVASLPPAPSDIQLAYVSQTGAIYYSDTSNWVRVAKFEPIDSISGQIELPLNKAYILEQRAVYAYYLEGITMQTVSGTASVTLRVDGNPVSGLSNLTANTGSQRTVAPQGILVPIGATVSMQVVPSGTVTDLSFTIEISRVG
jgi:hypothetical protein